MFISVKFLKIIEKFHCTHCHVSVEATNFGILILLHHFGLNQIELQTLNSRSMHILGVLFKFLN